MTLPNFLVVGAGRAGTSSLHYYLQQHPEIFIPRVKSPSYFYCHGQPASEDRIKGRVTQHYFVYKTAAYESLFDGVQEERAIGEVSPAYLASMRAVQHIKNRLPHAKLIVILRNPIDRFYARYLGRYRDGLERTDKVRSLLEKERQQPLVRDEAVGTYLSAGFCSHFLEAYLGRFSRQQLYITFYDDLKADGQAYMQHLFEFLGVDPTFKPDMSKRLNKSGGTIRNRFLRVIWTKSAMVRALVRPYVPKGMRDALFKQVTNNLVAQPLDPAIRLELLEIYRDEIRKLAAMTGRDLTDWLKVSP